MNQNFQSRNLTKTWSSLDNRFHALFRELDALIQHLLYVIETSQVELLWNTK